MLIILTFLISSGEALVRCTKTPTPFTGERPSLTYSGSHNPVLTPDDLDQQRVFAGTE